jgi:hypothetical protein
MPEAAFASKSHELVHTPRASAKQQRIAFHERPILRIGAAPSAHIVLDGPGVAEEHCRVELSADGRLTLIDRGSTAGTWLNGGRCVERMPLREGDEIKVGEHIFRVSAAQIRADAIAERLSAHTDWNDEERIRALKSEAEAWRARGRPARLLLPPARLQRASPLALQHPQLQEWFEASAARLRLAQGIRAWLLGFLPGALIGLLAAWPALSPDRPPDRPPDHLADHLADHPTPAPTQPALIPASCTERRVRPDPHEILQDIAVDLGVDHVELARTNNLELLAAPPLPELSACTQRLPLTRVDHIHVVQRDETWEILANRYRLALDRLRRYNPDLPRPLRAGDHVRLRIDPATLDQHQIPPTSWSR